MGRGLIREWIDRVRGLRDRGYWRRISDSPPEVTKTPLATGARSVDAPAHATRLLDHVCAGALVWRAKCRLGIERIERDERW